MLVDRAEVQFLTKLRRHVAAALDLGLSGRAIVEILIQIGIYAGMPASEEALEAVARVFADRKIAITLDDKARHWLGNAGYDPVYGARPLKRVIQHLVLDPLSLDVLDGKFIDGDVILADAGDGQIVFTK